MSNVQCQANGAHFTGGVTYQRDTDGKFVCFNCVPDSTWARYEGSKDEAQAQFDLSQKRSQQAKKNFTKGLAKEA